jgi:hypothetical protein
MTEQTPHDTLKEEPMLASLHRLSRDGRSWIAAEAAFAQAEVASDGRRLVVMLALVALVFGCLFAAVVLISVFLVVLIAPYVAGMANAAGLLSLGLVMLAAMMSWRIWYLASQRFGVFSVLKRWWNFAAQGPGRDA